MPINYVIAICDLRITNVNGHACVFYVMNSYTVSIGGVFVLLALGSVLSFVSPVGTFFP